MPAQSQPRRKRWIELSALLLASVCIHWAGLLAVSVTARERAREPTDPLVRGDNGDEGRDRATVMSEFSVQPPPPPPPQRDPAAPSIGTPPTQSSDTVVTAPNGSTSADTHSASTPPSRPAQPTPPPVRHDPPGTRRTGSVGEQRAMLPRAARCRDPVAGTWRAHKYDPSSDDWVMFTLRIQRHPDNRLQGSITARVWGVGAEYSSPPGRCLSDPNSLDYLVTMDGNGMLTDGNRVRFSATEARVARAYCRSATFRYNPDEFSGVIDNDRQEFNSVNNDGERDRNAPYVFRRIGCLPGDVASTAAASSGTVAP